MTTLLKLDKIKEHIIHREENLLLDSVEITNKESFEATLSICINKKDPLNRQIFLKEKQPNTYVISVPIYMEILALCAIVSTGKLKPGEAAIFASINNFVKHSDVPANQIITGHTKRLGVKKEFLKYGGSLTYQNTDCCSGTMTAYFNKINFNAPPEPPENIDLPQTLSIKTNKENRHKVQEMIICDELVHIDDEKIITKYTYPVTHPLTKGHFPNNPIMMGVMQWMSIEDGVHTYLENQNENGNNKWSCNATIYNQNKNKVADIKGIKLESWINTSEIKNQTEIIETKRINFRNMVHPNDTLFTVITDLTAL